MFDPEIDFGSTRLVRPGQAQGTGEIVLYKITYPQLWDATLNEWFHFGIETSDDATEPVTLDTVTEPEFDPDTGDLVGDDPATRLYVLPMYQDRMSRAGQGQYHVGLRVGVAEIAERKTIITPPLGNLDLDLTTPYQASSAPMPAYGVGWAVTEHWTNDDDDARAFQGVVRAEPWKHVAGNQNYARLLLSNGPWPIDHSAGTENPQLGAGTLALGQPAWCLYEKALDPLANNNELSLWGPVPGSWKLHYGVPGFLRIGNAYRELTPGGDRIGLFVQALTGGVAAAYTSADWSATVPPSVAAYPATELNGKVYNGSDVYNGYTLPSCPIKVQLPVPTEYTGGAWVRRLDPEVFSGDWLYFTYGNTQGQISGSNFFRRFIAQGTFASSKIGDVKWWNLAVADIPKGWRERTTMRGRVPVGYDSGDTDFDTIGHTGGSKSQTIGGGSVIQGGSGYGGSVSVLQPYEALVCIERYK